MTESLRLGIAKRIITPKIGAALYGYRPGIFSESVHDDLTLTVFYFEKENVKALMISATLCSIKTTLTNELLELIEENFNIPKGNCILHSTHTHSGPNLTGTTGWGDVDREYYENIFLPAFLEAIKEAMQSTCEVKVGIASGESFIGINRRELTLENTVRLGQNPWGAFDPKMTVISFADSEGRNIANIVHYGMHGTCAGMNREISRDFSGIMTDAIEEKFGGITAFFNGPEGDVGPRLSNGETTGKGKIEYAEEQGALAAKDALEIRNSIKCYQDAEFSVFSGEVKIPLDKRIALEKAKEEYEKYKENTVNLKAAKAHYYEKQISLYNEGYVDTESRVITQTIIRIGDVAFISFPYELFSEIGMRISRASKIPYTLSLSNTNGYENYFVTEDQICRGGYEVEMFKTGYVQPYKDNADWHLVTQTLENLEKS